MALDAGIYNLLGRNVRSIEDYDHEAQQAQTNKLALLLQQQQFADANTERETYKAFGTDALANQNRLYAAGLGKQALAYGKANLDAEKAKVDIAEGKGKVLTGEVDRKQKAFDYYKGVLGTLPDDPAVVRNFVMHSYTDPTIGHLLQSQGSLEDILAKLPTTPDAVRQWKPMAAMGIEKLASLAKVENVNLGGTMRTQIVNPATGQSQVVGEAPITESANNIATNATSRANNADTNATHITTTGMTNATSIKTTGMNNATTMRGQNLVDARSRESTAATMTKPFEVTGPEGTPILVQQDKQGNIVPVQGFGPKSGSSKPMTDAQAKSLLFGTRMQESDKVLASLETAGTRKSVVPGSMNSGMIGSAANLVSSGQQQQLTQAKRDFLNAVLRRESGAVIADSEISNGDKQYFPQPGDDNAVIAQKARNRDLAIRGVLAEVPEGQRASITPKPKAGGLPSASDIDAELRRRGH